MTPADEPRWIIVKGGDPSDPFAKITVTEPTGVFRIELRLQDDDPDRPTSSCSHMWNNNEDVAGDGGDYWHICDFGEFLDDMQSLDELRRAFARGEVEVGCPHPCWGRYTDGREECQACGEKRGPWPS